MESPTMNETQTILQLVETDEEVGTQWWVGGTQGIVGAERREVPETIRVGFLEEMTCQLTVGSQGIFQGPKGVLFKYINYEFQMRWGWIKISDIQEYLEKFWEDSFQLEKSGKVRV